MKTVFQILLAISICLLTYFCIMSIVTPIEFAKVQKQREAVVVESLIDIRKAEVEFKDQLKAYASEWDTLLHFLKTAQKPFILKEGTLSDAQLEDGLTEEKAVAIIRKGNQKEIEKNGLQNFRRDTTYVGVIEALYGEKYTVDNIDQLAIIPFSNDERFELEATDEYYISSTRSLISLFQARAHYKTYLHDLNRQELLNIIDLRKKLEKYPGLQVGSIEAPNNNAGNWE